MSANVLCVKMITVITVGEKGGHIGFFEACGAGQAGGLRSSDGQGFVPVQEGGQPVLPCHLFCIP